MNITKTTTKTRTSATSATFSLLDRNGPGRRWALAGDRGEGDVVVGGAALAAPSGVSCDAADLLRTGNVGVECHNVWHRKDVLRASAAVVAAAGIVGQQA